MLCSRKKDSLEEVRGEIEAGGGKALALACDVTDPDDVGHVDLGRAERDDDLDQRPLVDPLALVGRGPDHTVLLDVVGVLLNWKNILV